MKPIAISVLLLGLPILLGPLGGCDSRPEPSAEPQLVSSPNGEPLAYVSDSDRCEALLGTWFAGVDTNRDGVISQAELEADAQRWFQRADTDGDGFITVTELTALRRPMEPPPKPRMVRRGPSIFDNTDVVRRDADPVMAADTNLDFRVSREEMMALVARRYATVTRKGAYDKVATLADCDRRRFARPGFF